MIPTDSAPAFHYGRLGYGGTGKKRAERRSWEARPGTQPERAGLKGASAGLRESRLVGVNRPAGSKGNFFKPGPFVVMGLFTTMA